MSTPQQPEQQPQHQPGPASTRGPHPDRPAPPANVPAHHHQAWEAGWEAGYDAGRAQAMSPDPRPLVAAASGSRVYPGDTPGLAEQIWRERIEKDVTRNHPGLHVRWVREPYTGHLTGALPLWTVRWFAEAPTSQAVSDHTAEA